MSSIIWGVVASLPGFTGRGSPTGMPFDPENKLFFINGLLVGTGAQAATVMTVTGKSPAAYPDGYCYGFLTGFVGAELKKAVMMGSLSRAAPISRYISGLMTIRYRFAKPIQSGVKGPTVPPLYSWKNTVRTLNILR
jgi:hypothetical protein